MFRRFRFATLALLCASFATVTHAIPRGEPDNSAHPYVGQLFFYVPDEIDPRFTDPGAWFNCSGTLISPTVVVTAAGGDGGNDVWVSFSEAPNYAGLPPSANYIPDDNEQRYTDRVEYLDANPDWVRGQAFTHPEFTSGSFVLHDVGVIVLDEPVQVETYGLLPALDYLDQYRSTRRNEQRFTPVGYGLTRVLPNLTEGGDTREKASTQLLTLTGFGVSDGIVALFSNNNGASHQGGTCFGDSGGPIFDGDTNQIVAIISFGISPNCTGFTGAYRIDQSDDLEFIAEFLDEVP